MSFADDNADDDNDDDDADDDEAGDNADDDDDDAPAMALSSVLVSDIAFSDASEIMLSRRVSIRLIMAFRLEYSDALSFSDIKTSLICFFS